MIEKLKQAIIRSQEICEGSWDSEKFIYSISVEESAKMACDECGIEELSEVVHLLNSYSWNDSQEWAKK